MGLKKAVDINESRKNEDFFTGNWIFSSTRCLNYFQPERNSRLPLAFCLRSFNNSEGIFIGMFSQETTITNITDLGSTISQEMNFANFLPPFHVEFLYSKEGWMLFSGPDSVGHRRGRFFLVNIVTGKRLHVPDNSRPNLGLKCVFSTSSSSVDYVVNVSRQFLSGWTTIYVTRPCDEVWEVYTNDNWHGIYCFDYIAVVIFEQKVYCFEAIAEDSVEMIDLFDLLERIWVSVTITQAEVGNRYKSHIMEVDGIGIVKMYLPNEEFNMYRFFKLEINLNELLASWVEMTEQELENKSWFVGWFSAFCVKSSDRGATVYRFTTDCLTNESGKHFGMNIQVYDLKSGTSYTVFPLAMYPARHTSWVNLE